MISQQIAIRDLTWDDRIFFYKWINNNKVIKYSLSLFQKIKSKKEIDEWFRSVLDDKKSVSKAIVFNDKLVGYASVSSINKTYNSGEYFILIGDEQAWGKGIGTYVTKKNSDFAFKKLNVNRLSLTVSDINKFALKAYLNAGFVEEGQMRQACLKDGRYHDKVIMSIIKDDLKDL